MKTVDFRALSTAPVYKRIPSFTSTVDNILRLIRKKDQSELAGS